jgi:hypothetical protein
MNIKGRFKNAFFATNQDVYGMELLRSLSDSFKRPPLFTGSALRPICLTMIINDLVINQRKVVVELGAGVTTLYLAAAVKKYGLDCQIISVDEEPEWLDFVATQLKFEGLDDHVVLVKAPITPYEQSHWYDVKAMNEIFTKEYQIESLIVDGPKAYGTKNSMNREKALSYFLPFLSKKCFVYLDDCHRPGEKKILEEWSNILGQRQKIKYTTGGVIVRGEYYNFYPK